MGRLRRILTWCFRGLLFVFILLFAMKNTDPVMLKFYFGQSWQAPLALLLFLALVFGAVLGLLAGLERLFAQRREIVRLQQELARDPSATARAKSGSITAPNSVPLSVPIAASGADFEPSREPR
jgi:lipopolysaccharide assembly protein A